MAGYLQLVDLLAADELNDDADALVRRARDRLAELSREFDAAVQQTALATLSGRTINHATLTLFAHLPPAQFSGLLQQARMTDDEWAQLVPLLPPPARALLNERRDLPDAARNALAAMGPAAILLDGPRHAEDIFMPAPDLAHAPSQPVPEGPVAESGHPAVVAAANQLQDLLDRIRRYRARQDSAVEAPAVLPASAPDVASPVVSAPVADARIAVAETPHDLRLIDWGWETDASGRLVAATDVARAGMGHYLVDMAGSSAPDLAALMARRTAFRDRALAFDGAETFQGVWKLSGVPLFDPADGHFCGYRGTARAAAPMPARVQPGRVGLFGTGATFEKLSSMAHEVRTPLNAILGFAQMIDGEALGPAGPEYRDRARAIIANSERLMIALDDLTDAARIAQGRYALVRDETDIADTLQKASVSYQQLAQQRGVILDLSLAPGLPHVWTDRSVVERMLSRLLASVVATGQAGEIIWLSARAESGDWLRIQLSRPEALSELSADMLLDPRRMAEDMAAPPILGLGFSLRFVRQLCGAMGAAFLIEPRQFVIRIPALVATAQAS